MNQSPGRVATPSEVCGMLVFSLLGTARKVEDRLEEALGRVDLSLAKAGVLKHLAKAGEPLPLRDLAERHQCVRSNITQLVDRLEKDGLVRRRTDPDDRRSVLAELTPAGEKAYEQAAEVIAEQNRAIVGSLSPEDAENLQSVLARLVG